MDFGITGKWALVCGASKGLGLGCAKALVQEGVNVMMVARGAEALQAAAAALIEHDYEHECSPSNGVLVHGPERFQQCCTSGYSKSMPGSAGIEPSSRSTPFGSSLAKRMSSDLTSRSDGWRSSRSSSMSR